MNLSMKWLSEYIGRQIKTKAEVADYCDKMTYSGSKVEGFEMLFEELSGIVAGRVLSVEKHPDADKLSVCSVDVGGSSPVQIVTGAKNVTAGAVVPVALDGAVIHGGKRINTGLLRGVESQGMLCSLAELGLVKNDFPYAEEDGIFLIEENVTVGADICDELQMRDAVVEFEITPNRADCFSVMGLAFESAVTLGLEARRRTPAIKNEDKSCDISEYLSVEVKIPAFCPRYTARVVRDVKIAPSPLWLRARLRSMGVRPINNIVDITNLVMLEYGQPMHAFDYSCIRGKKITVRGAADGEETVTLDGAPRVLSAGMAVIADEKGAVAVAGVMGCLNSEIKEGTTTVVFESANFEKMSVRHTSRALGLRTESSANFEKGLDPMNTVPALTRALELVEELGCGTVVGGCIDVHGPLSDGKYVPFDCGRINALLGTDYSEAEMSEVLARLDIAVRGGQAFIPSWRADDFEDGKNAAADLAEEVARIIGYDNLRGRKSAEPVYSVLRGSRDNFKIYADKLHNLLCAGGFSETYTFSFISPKLMDDLLIPQGSPLCDMIILENPLGEETSALRTTLAASMMKSLSINSARRNASCFLYDMGRTYRRGDGLRGEVKGRFAADERNMLALGFYEKTEETGRTADFYTLSAAVADIMKSSGIEYKLDSDISEHLLSRSFHPGRSALIRSRGRIYGIMGEIHPAAAKNFGCEARCYIAELSLDMLYSEHSGAIKYKPLPRFPSSARDLALVCASDMESAAVEAAIREGADEILESVRLFDVYSGDKVAAGTKSLAYRMVFRHSERTLGDDEISAAVAAILERLAKMGISIRA